MCEDQASTSLLNFNNSYSESKNSNKHDVIEDQQDSKNQKWVPTISEAVNEIKQLYTIAFPMIVTGFLLYGKSLISTLFMGIIGKEALAGGSLSISFANITGYSVLSGLALGMEAISSQAYGAKQWPLMAQTLLRTIAILTLASIPISFLWLNVEHILIFFGQDPSISSIASTYLAFSLPDLFFQSLINPLKIYLRTQNITLPLMLSAALALLLHAPITYILVCYFSFGIPGVAIAAALTDLNLLATLFLYIYYSGRCRKPWQWQCQHLQGWSLLICFEKWRPILSLAVPSCISVCLEWWWYELMILLAGRLVNSAEALAAVGILMQATSFAYIFPSALSQAVSTRVGHELGANRPIKAKTSSMIALSCAVFTSFIPVFLTTMMRRAWGEFFTADKAVIASTAAVMPVVGLCELGNWPQTTGCGVLRGSARPTLAANINLGCFYGIGLPIAVLISFVMEMGLLGLWLGLLAAQIVCAIVMVVVLMRTDWVGQTKKAIELTRINGENEAQRLMSVMLEN